jgi:hypothetical protein
MKVGGIEETAVAFVVDGTKSGICELVGEGRMVEFDASAGEGERHDDCKGAWGGPRTRGD